MQIFQSILLQIADLWAIWAPTAGKMLIDELLQKLRKLRTATDFLFFIFMHCCLVITIYYHIISR